jgi:hypothetical protein
VLSHLKSISESVSYSESFALQESAVASKNHTTSPQKNHAASPQKKPLKKNHATFPKKLHNRHKKIT